VVGMMVEKKGGDCGIERVGGSDKNNYNI